MRVLLFIEPHPIRMNPAHFDDVARRFLPILASPNGCDVRVFANNATFKKIDPAALSEHAHRLIRTTSAEEDLLASYLGLPWEEEGISLWLDLMAGRGEICDHYLSMLRRIWRCFPFDIIVHWGENGAITRFIDECQVTRVAMELGCTRPPFLDSVVMDPYGTNGSGVIPKLDVEDLRRIVNDRPMSRHEALFSFSNDVAAQGYARQFQRLPNEPDLRGRNRKLAFLPLQLFDDANLLRFSPYNSITDVVMDVVPRLSEAGYFTLIKPHPASKFRQGARLENSLAKQMLRPWADQILWLEDPGTFDNIRLFTLADLVVTVNSSVGFEALYFDKTVVALGDAVYKPKSMFPSLDDVLSGTFDQTAYLDAVGLLRRFMLGAYLQPETVRKDATGFLGRLGVIHHLVQQGKGDPRHFAADYWTATTPAQTALANSFRFWGLSVPGKQEFVPPSLPTTAPVEPAQTGSLPNAALKVYRRFLKHLKAQWTAQRTRAWVEAAWSTPEGRAEVIALGQVVDPKYYLRVYDDIQNAGIDPQEHFCLAGIAEARSPRAGIHNVSEHALLAAICEGLTAPTSDPAAEAFRPILVRLKEHVGSDDSKGFLEWLSTMWASREDRARLVTGGALVSTDYYLAQYADVKESGGDPVHHYAWDGINERRSPCAEIALTSADEILACLTDIETGMSKDFLPVHPFPAETEDQRNRQKQHLRRVLATSANRIAVVAHLYYADLVAPILEALSAITEPFDLIVTLPDWGTTRIVTAVKAAFPDAVLYECPNRGRDIGPFMDVLPLLLDLNYDAVLKLQTKRGYFRNERVVPELGDIWFKDSLAALLGTPSRIADILGAFRTQPQMKMIGPAPMLVPLDRYPQHDGGALADFLLDAPDEAGTAFYAGTMFWVRPACLTELTKLTMAHFAPETGANDGALAHLVERLFGQAAGMGQEGLAAAPVDPAAPLIFAPSPATQTLDAYFSGRQQVLKKPARSSEGALIW
jgi:hypothetical protein